ncbi:MAG: TetR/AcrR family transcriptional regulator [Leptolyngbyaceae cyanobacterium SL_7_1]|nr:TetR/AcrR family transcriptional regulator [Leptolyngbyaceae cyanobacterium SL_7_1]
MLSNEYKNLSPDLACKPEQILKGAMQVFLQHGYAGTSMDRVAAKAGVSKHTIYNHFQGKQGLFIALIERLVLRNFHNEFGCELPLTDPASQVLRRFAQLILAKTDDPEYIAFVRLLFAESGRFPELAKLYYQEVIQAGHQFLSDYFKTHSEFHLTDPEMTARIFIGSLITYVFSQEVLHGKSIESIPKDQLINALIDLILSQRSGDLE